MIHLNTKLEMKIQANFTLPIKEMVNDSPISLLEPASQASSLFLWGFRTALFGRFVGPLYWDPKHGYQALILQKPCAYIEGKHFICDVLIKKRAHQRYPFPHKYFHTEPPKSTIIKPGPKKVFLKSVVRGKSDKNKFFKYPQPRSPPP